MPTAARARVNGTRLTPASPPRISSLVRAGRDHLRRVGVGGPTGRVVLEAAVGVVRGRDDDAVREAHAGRHPADAGDLAAVGCEDGVRDRRGRGVAAVGVDEDGDVVGDEHLESGGPRRFGQTVGVAPDEQRAVETLVAAVLADRLRRREDVRLVERGAQARSPVSRSTECDLLVDVVGVWLAV